MPQINREIPEKFIVRQAKLTPIPPPDERTRLGRTLMDLVAEIDASDDPPMSEEDLELELQMRRGGFVYDGR